MTLIPADYPKDAWYLKSLVRDVEPSIFWISVIVIFPFIPGGLYRSVRHRSHGIALAYKYCRLIVLLLSWLTLYQSITI